MKCMICEKETSNPKFCCKSCAATYNNRKYPKRSRGILYCNNCGGVLTEGQYKFCSTTCCAELKHRKVSVPKILKGASGNVTAIKRYISESRGYVCSAAGCGNTGFHNGKPLTLQLDHIDGNSDNNNLSNLRLLCPNCHTQTETFTTRQKKDTKRNRYLRKLKGYQPD